MVLAIIVGLMSPAVVANATTSFQLDTTSVSAAARLPKHGPVVKRDTIGRVAPTGSSAKVRIRVGTDLKRVTPVKGAPKWWRTTYKGKTVYVWRGHVSLHPESGLWPSKLYAVRYAKRIFGEQFKCIQKVVNHESHFGGRHAGGNVSGPYGIGQANPGTKMSEYGPYWKDDPATQLRWMKRYVKKYGGACGAWAHWQRNHSY